MKISLLSPLLSGNCLGRAFVLAKVLERHYEVEVVGPILPQRGLWKPLGHEGLSYKAVNIKPGLGCVSVLRSLLDKTTGDIVYASKPLLPSFGVGLLRRFKNGTPLVLDIDDWEFGAFQDLSAFQRFGSSVHLNTERLDSYYPFIWLMHKLVSYADARTVSSCFLKKKYGGVIVPHGRDTNLFDAARFDMMSLKEQYGFETRKVVMFLGTPRPRKGLEELVEAVQLLDRSDVVLVIVGVHEGHSYIEKLKRRGDRYLNLIKEQPFSEIPRFLAMADVVVIPQRLDRFTMAQVPAKIFDAMAMARPIVATAVSDIPDILGGGCGLVVEPQNVEQLAEGIAWILDNEQEAQEMGRRAREKCVREYSWDAIEQTLVQVFAQFE